MRTATDAALDQIAGRPAAPGDEALIERVDEEIANIVTNACDDFEELAFLGYSQADISTIIGVVLGRLSGKYGAKYGGRWINALDKSAVRAFEEAEKEANTASFNGVSYAELQDDDEAEDEVSRETLDGGTVLGAAAPSDYDLIAKVLGLSPLTQPGTQSEETGVAPAIGPVELTEEQSQKRSDALVSDLSQLSEPDAGTILTYAVCRLGEVKFGGAFIDKLLSITQNSRRV